MSTGSRKTARGSRAKPPSATALVPVAAVNSLARVPDAAGGEVVRDGGVIMVTGVPYVAHGAVIPASEVFFDADARPAGDGPWLGEADKVAWRDPATGYDCIILRSQPAGFLGGYVGVPPSHPLYGFACDAIPADIGIEVHGGITYAKMCQDGPAPRHPVRYEARRICHLAVSYRPIGATDQHVEHAHAWWFGFTCDHVADVAPGDVRHASRGAALGVAQTYRDDAYVLGEVRNLAAQLRAIADVEPMPARVGPPLPPASLDPRRRS
ncbi:hypothetical protein [Sphingomonas bacterium]|uniref:hypothetical protein n=1 Tax=Sphingomonas bacterium TaxID=1895847 RepID=UPI0015751FDA|nr:hypothetical protein [Sphingomonas bacterium]